MSWGAVAGAAISVGGGILGHKSQAKANKKAQQAADQAYQRNQQNMQPYLTAGNNAVGQMQQLNRGDFSSFTQSPDYQFAMQQGLQGLDRSAAARGNLYGGGHSADVLNYASGLANQNYGNYYNRLAGLAGMGQNAAASLTGNNNGYAQNTAQNAQSNASNNNALYGMISGTANNLIGNSGWGGGTTRSSAYSNPWQTPSSGLNNYPSGNQGGINNFGNNLDNFRKMRYG